jgi:hypothetical protein
MFIIVKILCNIFKYISNNNLNKKDLIKIVKKTHNFNNYLLKLYMCFFELLCFSIISFENVPNPHNSQKYIYVKIVMLHTI